MRCFNGSYWGDGAAIRALICSLSISLSGALCLAQAIQVPTPGGNGVVRAGQVSFVMPSPSPDLVEMGPDLRVLMEIATPNTNRLVAAFISPDELAKLPGGLTGAPQRYALVEVLRRAEFVDVDEATFKQVVDAMSTQLANGEAQSTMVKQQDRINEKIDDLGLKSGKVTIDKPVQLGSIFSNANSYGFCMLEPMASNGKTENMVNGVALVRVKNRLLYVYVYAKYEDKSTVDWVLKTTQAWADAILKQNP